MIKFGSWAVGEAFCEGTGEHHIFRDGVSHTSGVDLVPGCVCASSVAVSLVLTIMADYL